MDFSIKYFKDYMSFHVDDSHPVKGETAEGT